MYSFKNKIKLFIQRIIHSNWTKQPSLRKQLETGKRGRSDLKRRILFIFLMNNALFYSFNNSFNRTAKIFIQRIYSFKRESDYSLKKNKIFLKKCILFGTTCNWQQLHLALFASVSKIFTSNAT